MGASSFADRDTSRASVWMIIPIVLAALLAALVAPVISETQAADRFVEQAKRKCKAKKGAAKKRCVKSTARKLRKIAEQRRLARFPGVTIRTTEGGVPRIVADTYIGAGYGYGYALARENICSMAEIYTTVRGERSRFFGPDGDFELEPNSFVFTNLDSDLFARRLIADGSIARQMKVAPPLGPEPAAKQVVRGYVGGYNRYLKDIGIANLPDASCRGRAWVRPITELDVYLRLHQLATLGGLGVAVDGIANATPPGTSGSTRASGEPSAADFDALRAALDGEETNFGSNAVAFGSETTTTGKGMLLGNPHFPWEGTERFFQAQTTIPGKLNVSGTSLLGAPAILIGHTRNLAWTHTFSTARRFAVVKVPLQSGDPTRYLVDGKPRKMKVTRVTIDVRRPNGSLGKVTRSLYSTIYGPVTTRIAGIDLVPWTGTEAYALRDPNGDGLRVLNHFLAVNRAESIEQLVAALVKYQGIPWANTIATDSTGKVFYGDVGAIPNVDRESFGRCGVTDFASILDSLQLAVLDGSRRACGLLGRDPGASAPGILPPSKLPNLTRNDHVSNMNDSYWLANPDEPLEGFSPVIGSERTQQSLRTRNGLVQIERRLSGTDGRPGNRFDLADVREMIDGNVHHGALLLKDPLIAWCGTNPGTVAFNDACEVLSEWGGTERVDDPGAVLWREVMSRMLRVPGGPWTVPFDPDDPVNTPRGLDLGKPDVTAVLQAAAADLISRGIQLDATLGEHQYAVRNGERIPIPGGSGIQGMFNQITATRDEDGDWSKITDGSSFIMAASIDGSRCPRVDTIMTYSQAATNEQSPHFADQTRLFSEGRWLEDRFCPAQQKASPDLRIRNLNGGAKAVARGW